MLGTGRSLASWSCAALSLHNRVSRASGHTLRVLMILLRFLLRPAVHHFSSFWRLAASSSASGNDYPIQILKECREKRIVNWDDRIALQATWTVSEKGWQTEAVDWRETPFGVGLFAKEDIIAGTVLRIGKNGRNLQQFTCKQDIEDFCACGEDSLARLNYVKDYLWGYSKVADESGYVMPGDKSDDPENWFFGMWVPGNGLNHSPTPNTVYRTLPGGTEEGIMLLALTDIQKDEELYDDYRRHGSAPKWLKEFAQEKQITLNFAECNNFVCIQNGN